MRSLPLSLGAALLFTGCGPELLGIEVLPPRQSPTCMAPTANSAAAGRGLLDVLATEDFAGAYVGDLRFTATGGRLRIDSLSLDFALPDGAPGSVKDAASSAKGTQPLGDVLLTPPSADDVVVALVEDVVLLPRALAEALADDDELDIDATRYATVTVTLEPIVEGEPLGVTSSFPIDVCKGCLVGEPSVEDCPNGATPAGACRAGQDDEYWRCAQAPAGVTVP